MLVVKLMGDIFLGLEEVVEKSKRKNNLFLGTWKIEKREREKINAETRDYSELVGALRI